MVRGGGETGAEREPKSTWVHTVAISYYLFHLRFSIGFRSRDEHGVEMGVGTVGPPALGKTPHSIDSERNVEDRNPNRYRLERFGKAMSGSVSWEVPGAVLHGVYRP